MIWLHNGSDNLLITRTVIWLLYQYIFIQTDFEILDLSKHFIIPMMLKVSLVPVITGLIFGSKLEM